MILINDDKITGSYTDVFCFLIEDYLMYYLLLVCNLTDKIEQVLQVPQINVLYSNQIKISTKFKLSLHLCT